MKKTSNKAKNVTYNYDFEATKIATYSKKIADIDEMIRSVEEQDVSPLSKFFDIAKEKNYPVCFFAAGGSFSPAVFAMQLANEEGLVAMALTPMQVMTLSEEAIGKMMFLSISGSGGSHDMISATKYLLEIAPDRLYCVTTNPVDHKDRFGRLSNKVGMAVNEVKPDHALCVNLPVHKDGYVGTKKHVGMALLLYRALHPKETGFVEKLILPEEKPFEMRLRDGMKVEDISDLHIIYGALGQSGAVDLEGRMLESGTLPSMATDMKNFTHGRHTFLNTHLNSTMLMLVSPRDENFVASMMKLIPTEFPVITIRTKREDLLGALQLMICTFYLSIDLCGSKNTNPFKPTGKAEWGANLWSLDLDDY